MKKRFKALIRNIWYQLNVKKYGFLHKTSRIGRRVRIFNEKNLFLYENTNIDHDAVIMNTKAKLVFKKNSGAAFGLTVVTGGHISLVGRWFKSITNQEKAILDTQGIEDRDIIVEEDVWIGSRSTLLKGCHIGRGAVVGSGSVVRNIIPPYSMIVGNPAKVVGFKFTPDEVIEHEKALYPEEERLPRELLEKNYDKYFIKRIKEIKEFTRL